MNQYKKKLHLISLGCAKNLVDSEILLGGLKNSQYDVCLLYTSPSPRDGLLSRMPSSA